VLCTRATEDVATRRLAGVQIGRAGAMPDRNSSDGGRLTLEQKLESVWEGLHADGAADCPVCQGRIVLMPGWSSARCNTCEACLA